MVVVEGPWLVGVPLSETGLVISIWKVLVAENHYRSSSGFFSQPPKRCTLLLELLSQICEARGLLPYYSNGLGK